MRDIIRIKSIDQIHKALGIGAPKHPLVTVIPLEDLVSYDYGEYTYVMELYHISLKCGIDGAITYGCNSYDFHDGTLVFSKPEQTLYYDSSIETSNCSGWTLFFHPDLIRKSELGRTIEKYTFFSYEANEALHLSETERESITNLVKKIEEEYIQNIDKHSQRLIISNIHLLLDYCTRYYDRQFITRTERNKDIISEFENLLNNYFSSESLSEIGLPSVKYCAEQLHLSANYLSDLLKKETGKNGTEHIQYCVIEKAKDRLLSSTISVSEIAYDLGFEYPQYFSKLFKKNTGMTPAEYRSSN